MVTDTFPFLNASYFDCFLMLYNDIPKLLQTTNCRHGAIYGKMF